MQSEEKPISDSRPPTQSNVDASNGVAKWPPSILRLVLGAIVAAALSFIVLKTIHPVFVLPEDIAKVPEQAPIEVYEKHDKAQYEADGKNYSVLFGIAGALFGLSSVLLTFGPKSIKALGVAVVSAGGLGVVGAYLSNWMFNNMRATSGRKSTLMGIPLDSMMQSIIGYSLTWSFIGLGVGLGVGATRGFSKSLVAGISGFVGGALAAMLYVIFTAQFFMRTTMNQVIPYDDVSQAIWLVVFAVVIAICISLGSGEKQKKSSV
jgi:hypothetical protein